MTTPHQHEINPAEHLNVHQNIAIIDSNLGRGRLLKQKLEDRDRELYPFSSVEPVESSLEKGAKLDVVLVRGSAKQSTEEIVDRLLKRGYVGRIVPLDRPQRTA